MRKARIISLILRSMVWSERQQEVLGDLLGDRRGADRPPAGAHVLEVGDQRAAEAGDVDAGMVVEILVLGRQERRLDAVRHGLDRQIEAPLARELAHQRAVGGMDARRHRRLVAGQHFVVGQVLGQVADIDPDARRPPAAPGTCRCRRNIR